MHIPPIPHPDSPYYTIPPYHTHSTRGPQEGNASAERKENKWYRKGNAAGPTRKEGRKEGRKNGRKTSWLSGNYNT